MGFLDDILQQQSGGGLLGGLPATWQYTNPESLSPAEKQMMAMVGTQNPDQVGFAPLPASNAAFPVNGAAPLTGLDPGGAASPTVGAPPPATITAFDTGAAPIFATPPGSTPGNPALPPPAAAPAVNDGEEAASPIAVGKYQMPRVGDASAFAVDPAALPANATPTRGQLPAASPTAPAANEPGFMTGYQNFKHGGGLIGSIVAGITGKRNDAAGVAQQQQSQIANLTARALVNKGVAPDVALAAVQPGNGEMLKTLVAETFGAPKAPTVLGNGYVWNAQTKKVERAYEPDDKPPTALGDGYIWNPATSKVERAYTPEIKKGSEKDIADREQAIKSRGLDPKEPRNQQYILTGKFPREDAQPLTATDKKFIEEAEDAVFASNNVITALTEAKKLSPDTHTGFLSGTRATIGNNLPDSMVPDFVASKKSAAATSSYENLVLGQALDQLKSTFGAAPTEGERKILLDLQASVDKPDHVRQEILDRAIRLAQRKLDYNRKKATSLRDGTFYKSDYNAPGGQPDAAPQQTGANTAFVWTPDKGLSQAK